MKRYVLRGWGKPTDRWEFANPLLAKWHIESYLSAWMNPDDKLYWPHEWETKGGTVWVTDSVGQLTDAAVGIQAINVPSSATVALV